MDTRMIRGGFRVVVSNAFFTYWVPRSICERRTDFRPEVGPEANEAGARRVS